MLSVIRGGRVVDPSLKMDAVLDVLLADGVVARVGERLDALGRYLYHQQELQQTWHPTPPGSLNGHSSSSSEPTTPPRKRSGKPGPTRKR